MAQCTPPPTQPGREGAMFADLVRMGFPAETQVRCSHAEVLMWSRPIVRVREVLTWSGSHVKAE